MKFNKIEKEFPKGGYGDEGPYNDTLLKGAYIDGYKDAIKQLEKENQMLFQALINLYKNCDYKIDEKRLKIDIKNVIEGIVGKSIKEIING
jgi:hypothetical protein